MRSSKRRIDWACLFHLRCQYSPINTHKTVASRRSASKRSSQLAARLRRIGQALRGLDLLVDQVREADLILMGLRIDIDQGGAQIAIVRAAAGALDIAHLRLRRRFRPAPIPDPEPLAVGPSDVVAAVAGAPDPAGDGHVEPPDGDLLRHRIDRPIVTLQPSDLL